MHDERCSCCGQYYLASEMDYTDWRSREFEFLCAKCFDAHLAAVREDDAFAASRANI